jgi:spore maturation protein CgeB
MAAEGFLSNRLFDAAACASRVLTDPATGLSDAFGEGLRTYASADELADVLRDDRAVAFPDRDARLALASRVAREHSFDARAAVLVERARELRAHR